MTVSCNRGYRLSGERTLVCSSGSWSGSVGTCEVEKGISSMQYTCITIFSKNDSSSFPLVRKKKDEFHIYDYIVLYDLSPLDLYTNANFFVKYFVYQNIKVHW